MTPHKRNHIIKSLKTGRGFKHSSWQGGIPTTDAMAMRNAERQRLAAQINNRTLDADRKPRTVKSAAEIQASNILFWKKI